jgi:hypothetical protein
MKVLALIIGISNYNDQNNNLNNTINDANDLSNKFNLLGFKVIFLTDGTTQEIDEALYNFGMELNNYDVGIFYYAGHGMQINGENFLTATDTNFRTERDAKYSSMGLNKVLDTMDNCNNNTNIIILDACRNNPFEKNWNRGVNTPGLAPVYAPKGTLIAYATSPGQTASDGIGNNGLYTSVMLKNLEEVNLNVEEFFKRVRNSVFAFSNGKQTTWEHTSLTGTFYFNNGVYFNNKINQKYADFAIKDAEFIFTKSNISEIIKELKSHNWYKQSPAITSLSELKYSPHDDINELFILGRNFLQTANGGEDLANDLMESIQNWIKNFNTPTNENYFLDGILYEIYFDHNGIFRDKNLKDRQISFIMPLQKMDELEKSFQFIEQELIPFTNRGFYFLKFKNEPMQLNLVFDKTNEGGDNIYTLKDVNFEGVSVFKTDNSGWSFDENERKYQPILRANLEAKISQLSKIPKECLAIISNYDYEINQSSKINIPLSMVIKK